MGFIGFSAAVPTFEGSAKMSKTRILFAAITVLGLAGFARADDTPMGQQTPASGGAVPQTRYSSILPASTSCNSCPTTAGAPASACDHCKSDKGCLACLWSFFTYRRLPYTDINTYCCSCSEPARPPLFVYMLHRCADKPANLTLPDLSNCGGNCRKDGSVCGKCGRSLEAGCTSCPVCGK
jgi:hypothetical protein